MADALSQLSDGERVELVKALVDREHELQQEQQQQGQQTAQQTDNNNVERYGGLPPYSKLSQQHYSAFSQVHRYKIYCKIGLRQ